MTDHLKAIREALEAAQNGLKWYRDAHPEDDSGADDEMEGQITEALTALDALEAAMREPQPQEKSMNAREAAYSEAVTAYFKANPQLDSDWNRRIFYGGFCKGYETAPPAQQAGYTAGDMASAAAQGFRDGQSAQQAQPSDFTDAYQGAMGEVAIWKRRALEAEELNRKFMAEINGATFMGEPAQQPQSRPDFTDEWTGYLKDGETPFERFLRERKDLNALTKLYQRALEENERLKTQQPQAEAVPSPTAGMNMAQRILHVGGRNNAAGYVEFGSVQAVEALVRQVLRDLPKPRRIPDHELVTMYDECPSSDADMLAFAHEVMDAMQAAPKQSEAVPQETLYLLRRLSANRHAYSHSELADEMTRIVAEAYKQAEAVPPDVVPPDVEVIRKALERAFIMGQNYWADADSESYSANKRSGVTRQKFNAMRDEVCAAIAQQKGQQP